MDITSSLCFLIESMTCLYLPCREMAVKFNDYFEFPREFDMAPYTAATLAELEGAVTRNNQMFIVYSHVCMCHCSSQ